MGGSDEASRPPPGDFSKTPLPVSSGPLDCAAVGLVYLRIVDQDTSSAQNRRYHELLRRLTPAQRAWQADALTRSVRTLAEAGIRLRHPGASDEEVRARLAVRLYGRKAALRLCREIPDDAV